MSYSRKELQELTDQPSLPNPNVKEKGLTSKQREILEKTMHRHDKAFKNLAQV
ncbi:MAG: hypothetical protein M8353_09395 [ANME-2 cluster archaeon]|nr:hypothetical protein [ANME-2 cluster archaeon]